MGVLIGVVSCGIGATSVREWLPKGSRFPNPPTLTSRVRRLDSGEWESDGAAFEGLVARLTPLGPGGFRAVLWHQGESDANQADASRTLTGTRYREYLSTVIQSPGAALAGRRRGSWRKSATMCRAMRPRPTSGLPRLPVAGGHRPRRAGLGRPQRLPARFRRQGCHFSGPGLREHGLRWADKVGGWINSPAAHRKPAAQ